MANWCNNRVFFNGNEEALNQIQHLFKTMAVKQKKENCGQLPDFITEDKGYFFDIDWNYDDCDTFVYMTKWSPNTEVIQQIAEHFKVDFTHDYEESGCCIYGKTICENGILSDIYLEDEDFERYHFDEENAVYHFEEEIYDSDYEILEILLERKTAKHSKL